MKKVYSYDVFDTCLTRACGIPQNVFELLAFRVLGCFADVSSIRDFSLIRTMAEEAARKELLSSDNEEVTLNEIYQFCDFSNITSMDNHSIMMMEMEVEASVLMPVKSMRDEINHHVKSGATVVYISDMYLPEEFLKSKLKAEGFYVNDNIFLSSTVRKTKSSGHLFDYVASKLGVKGTDWKHIGDNHMSDYEIPRRKGIAVELVKNNYNLYETASIKILQDGCSSCATFPFTLSRAVRLSLPDTPNYRFAATFIAPMFVSYVYQILTDASRRNIKRIFFLARDGYILYHIAQEFARQFPDIELRYLYVSRHAVYLAGLNHLSPEEVFSSFSYLKYEHDVKKILYELQMTSFDYTRLSISGLNGEEIVNLLFQDSLFLKSIESEWKERTSNIISYFQQEGLTKGNCAIVDVVGSRRCQHAINNILSRHQYPTAFGYFFEVTWKRIFSNDPFLAMNYQEKVYGKALYNRVSQPLYEQFFAISNHLRTINYKKNSGKIEPVFETDFIPENYKRMVFDVNKAVCTTYARIYKQLYIENPIVIIQTAQEIFSWFCYVPKKDLLKAIENFICTGSGEANEALLSRHSLLYTILHIKDFFRWPEGQLVYSSGMLYPFVIKFLEWRFKRKRKKI